MLTSSQDEFMLGHMEGRDMKTTILDQGGFCGRDGWAAPQTQEDERVDTWGSTPTLELPLLTQEQCQAEMLRLVSKGAGK
jgi:hypothetical protein